MKKLFFFCYCILFTFIINAQPKYFEKDIAWGMTHSGRKIILLNDDTYVIAGNYRNIGETKWKAYVLNINQVGDTIWRQNYELPTGHLKCFDFLLSNNYIYLTGEAAYNIDESNYDAFIMKLSIQGDSLSYYTTNTVSQKSYANAIIATDNNSLILAGAIDINTHRELYATKIAADGTILWQYIDTTYTRTNYFTDILPDGTGGYYLYGSVNQYAYGLVATGDLLLLHLNANGQMIDQHTYSIGETDYSGYLIRSNDGNLLLGMAHGGEDNFVHGKALKINPNNHQIIWQSPILYIDDAVNTLIELPDGSIITTGTTRYPTTNSPGQMSLVKITADGDPMWSRQYGGQWHDYGYDVALSPDGGFVAVGRKDSAVVQTAFLYIVKTNCMGLLTEPQANFTYTSTALTASFQNLSQFVYPDSIDGGHYIWDFGDGTTPQIDNNTSIAHTFPAYGTYTVRLTAVVCSDTSVVEQVVGVFPVGVSSPSLVSASLNDQLFRVLPNPSNGSISIDIGENHNNVALTLLSIDGKTMLQTPLQKGLNTLQLGQLPTGIYYYVVSSDHTLLGRDKLAIIK